jgi:glycosyltransferase involved in cell wall biosynthesis
MGRDKVEKKYILITSQNFPSGGAGATYLNLFCRGLKLNDCSVEVYLLKGHAFGNFIYEGPRRNVTSEGIPYTYLGLTKRPQKALLKFKDELLSFIRLNILLLSFFPRRKSINLFIYSSEIQFNIPITLFCKLFGIKISKFVSEIIDRSEFKGSFLRQIKRITYRFNYRFLNKMSDKLIVFSYYLKNEYLKMGFAEKNIVVQPNLTDFRFWESPLNDVKFDIGYSGAPYLKDGLLGLFKAISLLNKQNVRVSLVVIGDSTFGESLLPPLRVECEKLGIVDQITFTGLVESASVRKYLAECRILAITRPATIQTQAGFPTKLGEYYATGRPVLATKFGDLTRYFTDGEEIVLAECDDPESIASKILWMLNNTKELDEITKKGFEKAKKLLEYQVSVRRIIESIEISA